MSPKSRLVTVDVFVENMCKLCEFRVIHARICTNIYIFSMSHDFRRTYSVEFKDSSNLHHSKCHCP